MAKRDIFGNLTDEFGRPLDDLGLPFADGGVLGEERTEKRFAFKGSSNREKAKSVVKKGQKLFKKAQSAGRKFVEFRNNAKKAFGDLEGRSEKFNTFLSGEPLIAQRKDKRFSASIGNTNPFGEPTNESIGLLRSPTRQKPIAERLKDFEGRMNQGQSIFSQRAKGFEENFFGIKKNERGQATIEAIFSIFVFAVIGFAIIPLYYQILNSFLIPAIEGETFGSLQVLIWQSLPLLVTAGMAFAVFQFFKPKIRQV